MPPTKHHLTKEDYEKIAKIFKRVEEFMGDNFLSGDSRLSLLMDIEHTHAWANLDFDAMLTGRIGDLLHDLCGIHRSFQREQETLGDGFMPRLTIANQGARAGDGGGGGGVIDASVGEMPKSVSVDEVPEGLYYVDGYYAHGNSKVMGYSARDETVNHVNEYLENREAYGGPEEGGWCYSTGTFIKCHGMYETRTPAKSALSALNRYLSREAPGAVRARLRTLPRLADNRGRDQAWR